jgi:hypothetical protein
MSSIRGNHAGGDLMDILMVIGNPCWRTRRIVRPDSVQLRVEVRHSGSAASIAPHINITNHLFRIESRQKYLVPEKNVRTASNAIRYIEYELDIDRLQKFSRNVPEHSEVTDRLLREYRELQ